MKEFFKYTLATITGLIFVTIVAVILGIGTLVGMVALSEQETIVTENSLMVIRLDGPLEERSNPNPIDQLVNNNPILGVDEILSAIEKAYNHEYIKGIYIESSALFSASPASIEEIRNALLRFKEGGKFIVAYSDHYTQGGYYLCSVADKIILNPQGNIYWNGVASQPIFFKDLLDKIGINMQIFKVGTYKSAVEPFTSNSMSEANREQLSSYLQSVWNTLCNEIAVSRQLSPSSLKELADQGVFAAPAEQLIEAGLADTLLYLDGVQSYLKQLMGMNTTSQLPTLELEDMANVQKNLPTAPSGNIIAVYYACGNITDVASNTTEEEIVGTQMAKELSELRKDNDVKAVVIRVNSPGGSAFASEQIWREVSLLKKQKPVIVSMGGVAASGGYYISCAADSIFAEPTTLTGSIGIYGMIPDMQELLNTKLGIYTDVVKTNRYADLGDISRPLNEGEKVLIQQSINQGYELFVKRCADGRKMTISDIQEVAEGRIWTGETALQHKLVDRLGGLDEAIKAAAASAEITSYSLINYPTPKDPLLSLWLDGADHYIESRIAESVGEYAPYLRLVERIKQANHIQAHIGFDPNFNF